MDLATTQNMQNLGNSSSKALSRRIVLAEEVYSANSSLEYSELYSHFVLTDGVIEVKHLYLK